jgi:putative DNA primase/helicase
MGGTLGKFDEEEMSALPPPEADDDQEAVFESESMSDDFFVEAWVQRFGENWRYVPLWGKWFHWNGRYWEENTTNRAFDLCRELTRIALLWKEVAAMKDESRRRINSATKAAAIFTLLKSYQRIATEEKIWDADPWMLATPEGVIDLKAGKLIESSREQYCTKVTSVSPAKAECPLWLGIIDRAARGDESMRSYLQRWCGYFLTGDTREECFLFVHGPGGSGKSTFVRVISEIMGTYSRACNMDAFTTRGRQEHSTEIAKLAGSRIVVATESEVGAKWNESRIKALTGRDKIAARFMRQDEFEFMPTFKIAIATNHRPGLKSVGEEMRRRVHLIEFPETIPEHERDLSLPEKLKAEYPAILHWMLQGCIDWQICGLGKPERVQSDTEEYLKAQDVLGAWIEEFTEPAQSFSAKVTDCYKSYVTYAKERGEFEPSITVFSEQLVARGFNKKKSNGLMVFKDIRLITLPSAPQ